MIAETTTPVQEAANWLISFGPLAALTVLARRMGRKGWWLASPWALFIAFDAYWGLSMAWAGAPVANALVIPIHQAAQAALIAGVMILMVAGVKRATHQEGLA